MGRCKYCGEDAGFFSHVHKECEEKQSLEKGIKEKRNHWYVIACKSEKLLYRIYFKKGDTLTQFP